MVIHPAVLAELDWLCTEATETTDSPGRLVHRFLDRHPEIDMDAATLRKLRVIVTASRSNPHGVSALIERYGKAAR